ncbi:hypothetical protein BD324DRAFT_634335 [Kockovaella imperatae]|uniref:Zinc-finger domain-containing protein n=1 Tax=Kockovaella imperatae TaxID=4999 RepID=A0A1Y1UAV6_9TREE|nr:hypothetical protein BD324DRAFT_634335 [Kockovaella imperatae]ORX34647.1 hypothetical protein BD324DRAFT_634335 [Kockovaella imperatae]
MSDKGKERASPELAKEVASQIHSLHEDESDEEYLAQNYETQRQRRILENQLLLTTLGFSSSTTRITTSTASPTRLVQRKKRPGVVYDRSGHVISRPLGDEKHTMACVEIPPDRQLTRRIQAGEYQDCSHWAEGEDRRWRFGLGRGGKVRHEEPREVGGVGESFRWRVWRGLDKELRKEMRKRGLLNEIDQRPVQSEDGQVSAYSDLPGAACHQCRRKSEKLKMQCRNVDPLCRALFCETCCQRYSYFSFDPESRSFICPLCRDCCNCSNCIRKRHLGHLLPSAGKGGRSKSLRHTVREQGHEGMTVQAWIDKATEERVGIPFDRVRLVDRDMDVISPYIEPELKLQPETTPKKRKQSKQRQTKKHKKKKESEREDEDGVTIAENGGEGENRPVVLRFKVPGDPAARERVKEVDSDGDTIDHWSGDESETSLTPLSDTLSPVPPRLAFPPRPVFWDNIEPPQIPVSIHNSPSPPSDSSETVKRRRRPPPPMANIVRAPRHAQKEQPLPQWHIPPQQAMLYDTIKPGQLIPQTLDFMGSPDDLDVLENATRLADETVMLNGNRLASQSV